MKTLLLKLAQAGKKELKKEKNKELKRLDSGQWARTQKSLGQANISTWSERTVRNALRYMKHV